MTITSKVGPCSLTLSHKMYFVKQQNANVPFSYDMTLVTQVTVLLGTEIRGYVANAFRPSAGNVYSAEKMHNIWWSVYVGMEPRINVSYCCRVIFCTISLESQHDLYMVGVKFQSSSKTTPKDSFCWNDLARVYFVLSMKCRFVAI